MVGDVIQGQGDGERRKNDSGGRKRGDREMQKGLKWRNEQGNVETKTKKKKRKTSLVKGSERRTLFFSKERKKGETMQVTMLLLSKSPLLHVNDQIIGRRMVASSSETKSYSFELLSYSSKFLGIFFLLRVSSSPFSHGRAVRMGRAIRRERGWQ